MRQQLARTADGRAMIMNRMTDAFNQCLPEG